MSLHFTMNWTLDRFAYPKIQRELRTAQRQRYLMFRSIEAEASLPPFRLCRRKEKLFKVFSNTKPIQPNLQNEETQACDLTK
ncbi:unnamed protein product [Orchesella dallaii]|uniref:Uncharacterized protein n=1 Tax=Orchesella dallaii TaxID=48710 RepID=A0ABP1R5J1_9HEXA